jgi:dienelactone hydrolase
VRHSEAGRLHWSADGRWLFLDSPRQLFALPLRPAPGAGLMTLLGGKSGRHVLGPDPAAPASMLVIEDVRAPGALHPTAWRLLRLVPGRPAVTLFRSRREISAFIPGQRGENSFVKTVEGDRHAIRRIGKDGVAREVLSCVRLEQCQPLSSPAPGELLLSADVGGDLERLLRLDRSGRLHLVHQDPAGRTDLADAAFDPADGRPLFASYRSIAASTHAVAPDMAPHSAAIRQALGPGFRVSVGRGPNARWLVAKTDDRLQHPLWYLYDPATKRLAGILAEVENKQRKVPAEAAARRIPVSWRASDGFLVHGFVAVPPGADPARVPLIVSVHGGPWSHMSAGWSSITQFLVNRGYAVFEPNFRGSTGHGRSYAFAAGSDFGNGRAQSDVVEGTRFLLAEGIGDPARVGITGISYGGYAALLGVTFEPDLFRVAVAAMPPTDFGWVMRWQIAREQARGFAGLGLRNSLAAMALDPTDPGVAARLAGQSPAANASRLKRPVLLIAGGRDESVPIRSVVDYAARLRALGRDVSLFVDPKSGHRIEEPATQEQYLYLMERMLGANLGRRWGPRPTGEAGRSLARNLRLAGRAHPLSGG